MQAGQVSQSPAEDFSGAVKPQAGVPGGGMGPRGQWRPVWPAAVSKTFKATPSFSYEGLGGQGDPRSGSYPTAYLSTSERDVFVCSAVGPP